MSNNLTMLNQKELAKKLQDIENKETTESFTTEVILSGTSDVSVPNKLTFVPSRYIIVSQSGSGTISKGKAAWSKKSLTLRLEKNVTAYSLKKEYTTISGTEVLTNVELVPAAAKEVTAKITFLK